MDDLFVETEPKIHPGRKLSARVEAVLIGDLPGFRTRPVEAIELDVDGIVGDGHRGFLRRSGGREPWYPRGSTMRSGRQITLLSVEELQALAADLGLPQVDPAPIGGNILLAGIRQMSFLPAGTRLFFDGGAALVVEAQNAPCRHAGAALGADCDRADLDIAFPKRARRRRGLVASVERPGILRAGGAVSVKIPEQWIYG